MKFFTGTFVALNLIAGTALPNIGSAQQDWISLFDGRTLDNWTAIGEADWTIVGNAVEGSGESGFLVSNESYDDFELSLEFWTDADANSGIFIRCSDGADVGATNSYEVNIFDKRPDQTYRTGGIVNFAAPTARIDAAEQWNTFNITANGSRLIVQLNGTVVVDIEDDTYAGGPIALQYGSGIVKFRNVRISAL